MNEGNAEASSPEISENTSLRDALEAAYDASLKGVDSGEATAQDAPEAKPAGASPEAEQSNVAEAETPIEPPAHWSDEHKEAFRKLDRHGQTFLLDRHKSMESDYTRKTTEIAEQRKRYESVVKALEPYRPKLQAYGLDEATAVQRLIGAQQYLEANPTEAIKKFAADYGVDLSRLVAPVSEQSTFTDPETDSLRRELQQIKSNLEAQERARRFAETQTYQAQIDSFKDSKDEKGEAKYPHFDSVRVAMGALMQTGEAKDLADAYERAVWQRPELRQELLDRQRKEQEAKAKAEAEAKARDAKGRFIPSGKGIPRPEGEARPKTLREELDAQMKARGL